MAASAYLTAATSRQGLHGAISQVPPSPALPSTATSPPCSSFSTPALASPPSLLVHAHPFVWPSTTTITPSPPSSAEPLPSLNAPAPCTRSVACLVPGWQPLAACRVGCRRSSSSHSNSHWINNSSSRRVMTAMQHRKSGRRRCRAGKAAGDGGVRSGGVGWGELRGFVPVAAWVHAAGAWADKRPKM